jgi:hypothetical protein
MPQRNPQSAQQSTELVAGRFNRPLRGLTRAVGTLNSKQPSDLATFVTFLFPEFDLISVDLKSQ